MKLQSMLLLAHDDGSSWRGDGSGAGSSQRPVHLDLNLPPGRRDELSAVIDDLAEAERKIQRAETEIQQIQEALQEIEGLNESRVEGLQANLGAIERELARLRTCLSEVDERVEQARSMDSARDQERARQQAELRAQMDRPLKFDPFLCIYRIELEVFDACKYFY
ncbi:hypothetical protein AHAS_Ahas06G0194300 [Arachis hypogaea]